MKPSVFITAGDENRKGPFAPKNSTQKIAWDPSYGWADDDMNTLQWSLGASYSF